MVDLVVSFELDLLLELELEELVVELYELVLELLKLEELLELELEPPFVELLVLVNSFELDIVPECGC